MIFLSSTICVGFDAHASYLYIGRVLGETDYKIKVISGILEKSKSGKKLSESSGYSISYGNLVDNDEIIDEVVISVYKAPHSYTGENIIEISCHGSNYIQQRIISLFTNSYKIIPILYIKYQKHINLYYVLKSLLLIL